MDRCVNYRTAGYRVITHAQQGAGAAAAFLCHRRDVERGRVLIDNRARHRAARNAALVSYRDRCHGRCASDRTVDSLNGVAAWLRREVTACVRNAFMKKHAPASAALAIPLYWQNRAAVSPAFRQVGSVLNHKRGATDRYHRMCGLLRRRWRAPRASPFIGVSKRSYLVSFSRAGIRAITGSASHWSGPVFAATRRPWRSIA